MNLLLHEIGHAYHDFLALTPTDLIWKRQYPDEFAEFAAITMTHLARPFLARDRGGFLSPAAAARARDRYFDELIVGGIGSEGIPDLSLADIFQHWVYAEAPEDVRPADLDAKWAEFAARFTPWVDWTGLEDECASGWQQSAGFFGWPFYYVNYELAHLGALQALGRAQTDPAAAWRDYRAALALGNTRSLPELFAAAGTCLPFDRDTVRAAAHIAAAQLAD